MKTSQSVIFQVVLFLAMGCVLMASDPHEQKNKINQQSLKESSKIHICDDITLYLVHPYKTVIQSEGAHLYLGIKNNSNTSIKVNLVGETNVLRPRYASGQILAESIGKNKDVNLTKPNFIPNWEDLKPILYPSKFGYIEISPKGHAIFGSKFAFPNDLKLDYDLYPQDSERFRLALLTGPNEWAFSNWQSGARRRDIDRRNNGETLAQLRISQLEEYPVKKLNIEGTDYLFALGTRVCVLPKGVTPDIQQQGKGLETKLVISFPGTNYEPVVHHFNSMATLSGPPELVPHLVALNELKAKLKADSVVLTEPEPSMTLDAIELSIEESAEVVAIEPAEKLIEKPSNWWLWLLGVVIFVGGIFVLRSRK